VGRPPEPSPAPSIAPLPAAVPAAIVPPDPCAAVSGNPFLSAFATAIPCPGAISLTPEVVATNMGLAALFVLFFGLTSEVFNSTIDENRRAIGLGWARLTAGPARLLAPVAALGTAFTTRFAMFAPTTPLGATVHAAVILGLVGFIYAFLARDFSFDMKGVILLFSMILGIGLVTYLSAGTRALLAQRRFRATASIRLYGTAVAVAVASVLICRVIGIAPGIVFGFVATSLIIAPTALGKRDEALLVVVPAIALLVASLTAFMLLGSASQAATLGGVEIEGLAHGTEGLAHEVEGIAPSFLDSVLAVVFVAGLEGLVFMLLPLKFLHGSALMRWSKPVWALFFGTAVFLWWQLLLNRNQAYLEEFNLTSTRVVMVALVLFGGVTAAIYLYFRFRSRGEEVEEDLEVGEVGAAGG
jgi:hypothetical protein